MRIVSLEPHLTELCSHYGLADNLVGISSHSNLPEFTLGLPKVSFPEDPERNTAADSEESQIFKKLGEQRVDPAILSDLKPDIILARGPGGIESSEEESLEKKALKGSIKELLGDHVETHFFAPLRLNDVYDDFKRLARILKVPEKGISLAQKTQAQNLDWADNFYDRIKNKKVTFLSQVEPPTLAGRWITDMISLASAQSQAVVSDDKETETDWKSIRDFRPDVIVIAPEGKSILESRKLFKVVEKLPIWDDIIAVKRGAVFFTDGLEHFYRPGPGLINSMSILISILAGFDSGYISPRDSFYRLRWLEMQRHRI